MTTAYKKRCQRARGLRCALLLLLSASIVGTTSPVEAQQPTDSSEDESQQRARQLFQNGAELYEEGWYEEAVLAFQEGYELSGAAPFLYNIANCYERLGNFDETLAYLLRYRAFVSGDEREVLNRRIRNIERRIEERGDAAPEQPAPVAQPAEPVIAPTFEPTPPPEPASAAPAAPPEEPSALGALHWTLIGVTAAGLATGTVFSILASQNRSDIEAGCQPEGGLCRETTRATFDDWDRNALLADVSWGVAAASGITLVLLLLLDGGESDDANMAFRPTLFETGARVDLSGRF